MGACGSQRDLGVNEILTGARQTGRGTMRAKGGGMIGQDGKREAAAKLSEPDQAMTEQEILARIGVVSSLIDGDPARLGPLLGSIGTDMATRLRLSPHAPTTLALMDELETLVALLALRRDALAGDIEACRAHRQAHQAYAVRRPANP